MAYKYKSSKKNNKSTRKKMRGGADTPPFESDIPAIPIQEQVDVDVGPLELDDYTGENNSHYMNDESGDTTFESVISDVNEGGRKIKRKTLKRKTLKKKGKTRKTKKRKTMKIKKAVKKGKSRKTIKRRKLFHFRSSAIQKKGGADTITEDTSPPAYNEAYEEYISLNP